MFVSGSSYQILQLGQPLAAAAGALPVAAANPAEAPQASNGKRKLSVAVNNKPTSSATSAEQRASPASSKGGGNKGGPSLLDLIEAGMLTPGNGNMSVTYKGSTYTGTLQGNGTIAFNGSVFNTPSAFSVHVKRLVTPNKQGDDGWHSVYVNGTLLLNAVRQQYNARGQQGSQGQAPAPGAQPGQQQAGAAKVARKQQASPRRQQQQPQQQPQQAAPGQVRPPLPKLKLGNIKGLPQQQQLQTSSAGKPPALPQSQQPQPGGQPNKLKLKQPLKLSLGKLGGSAGAGTAAPGGQQQQQLLAAVAPGSPILLREPLLGDHQVAAVGVQQPPAPAPGNPHWVRCCRCEVWRCVPEPSWGAVQAMGSTWYCEDAGWDVAQAEPFSPPCLADDVWPGGAGGGGTADPHDLLMAML